MGSDGVFSSKAFGESGVAAEAQFEASDLETAVGDPLVIVNAPVPKELVVENLGWRIKNRTSIVSKAWPRQSVMLDELPARHSNAEIVRGVNEGAFWTREVERRRRLLARHGWAYLVRFSQEPAPTADDLAAARAYVEAHRDDPAEPEPVKSATYERAATAMLGDFDGQTGVGVARKIE